MKTLVLLFTLMAASCQATTTDREDVAGSRDSALATFLQPLEVRLRDERNFPERQSRQLSYLGGGYGYSPYTAHYSPYGSVYGGQHGQYNPYAGGLAGYGGGIGGFGGVGATAGAGGFVGGGLGGGIGGYPVAGQLGYGLGQSAYPYGNGWNALQSPTGYGSQLGGYYNRGGLYV